MPRIAALRAAGDDRSVWSLTLRHFPRVVAGEVILGIGVLIILGVLLAASLAASFFATAKASEALACDLGRREAGRARRT